MSANVETMFSVREKPWHGLGTIVSEAPTSADALELAGLNWRVDPKPVYDEHYAIIPGYQANTRDSDGSVLGIVSGRYSIVQNADAFAFTDFLVGEGITYETAGSLRGGRQIWLLGKMPERYIAGDKVEPYICFTNTHDGSGAVRCCMTPVRVVCNNTLNMALKGAKRTWSSRHIGDVLNRVNDARETLELADTYMKALEEEADRLANEIMPMDEVKKGLDRLFPVDEKATDRQKQTAKEAKDQIMVCMFRPDIAKFLGTKWGFLNAVSDYVGHSDPVRKTKNWKENRWADIIGGANLLDKAVSLVAV